MRDPRFIAAHRGGPLRIEQHRQLMAWACLCVEHALPILGGNVDYRILNALDAGRKWADGKVTVGDARNAAFAVIAAARESTDPIEIAIFRAAGHAVATAHMADHSPGGAEYVLKAFAIAGKDIEEERVWQDSIMPEEVKEMISDTREKTSKWWCSSRERAKRNRELRP